jgi:2-polyprenyl-3-methyl-5-hydroxy-6-metoxy-1,4-benzoquinol methylase
MSEDWDELAKNWDRGEGVQLFARQAFAALISYVNVYAKEWKSKRVLDFGCGTGLLAERLAPLVGEVVALDISQEMIDVLRAKKIQNVTAICADIGDRSVSSASWCSEFGLIVASSVCGFLPNYEATVDVLSQKLNATGYFVQWDWLSSGDDESGLTLDRISNAFTRANLKCVHIGTAFEMPFGDEKMPVLMGVASAT